MILGDLTAASGPPCPGCGCRDSDIVQPATGDLQGLAICGHCGRRFSFRAPATEEGAAASETAAPPEPPARRRRSWRERRATR
jgi:hypothetical protein